MEFVACSRDYKTSERKLNTSNKLGGRTEQVLSGWSCFYPEQGKWRTDVVGMFCAFCSVYRRFLPFCSFFFLISYPLQVFVFTGMQDVPRSDGKSTASFASWALR